MPRAVVKHPKDTSNISGIKLGLLASQDIVKLSVLERPVSSQKEVGDARLGLPQYNEACCSTCGANVLVNCPGHFGHIKLATAVYHPAHVRKLCSILQQICLNCGELRNGKRVNFAATEQQQHQASSHQPLRLKQDRTSTYIDISSDDEGIDAGGCKYCSGYKNYPHPRLSVKQVQVKANESIEVINLTVARKDPPPDYWAFLGVVSAPKQLQLSPVQALNVLRKVSSSALQELGIDRPEAFVLETFPVPPNCMKAAATIMSEGPVDIYSSPATVLLKRLVERNAELSIFGKPTVKKESELQLHIQRYLRLQGAKKIAKNAEPTVKGKVCATSDISSIWKCKMMAVLAKRNDFSAMAVLTGDPNLPLDQILIPETAAQEVTSPESVNETNYGRLQALVDEWQRTREAFPGNLAFFVQRDGVCFDLQLLEDKLKLELGDVVHRPLGEGDVVVLDRAPSLQTHSLTAFSVKLHKGQTIQMNPLACPLFGADFDGDRLLVFVPQSLESKAEAREILALQQQLKSPVNQDSLIEFTQDVLVAAHLLVSDCRIFSFEEFSMLVVLQEEKPLPVPAIVKSPKGAFWTSCQAFSLLLPASLTFSFGFRDILIKDGELLQVDDNSSWLRSSKSSLVYVIQQQLGAEAAVKYLSLSSKVLNQVLLREGFSVGLGDFNLKAAPGFIDEIKIGLANVLTAETEIEAVIGRTLKKESALQTMASARSKGKLSNIRRHVACLGAGSGGFIKQSFWDGLDSHSFIQHCNDSRAKKNWHRDEVHRLRKGLVVCLADMYIGYDGTIRYRKGQRLIRPHYRDSGFKLSDSAGEAVGLLAALSMGQVLYDMVQPEHTHKYLNMFKETLLSDSYDDTKHAKFSQNDEIVVLRLRRCSMEECYCLEARLLRLQSHFQSLTLEQLSSKVTIEWAPGGMQWICHMYLKTHLLENLSLMHIHRRIEAHLSEKQEISGWTFLVSYSSRPVPGIHFCYRGNNMIGDGTLYDDTIGNSLKKLKDELIPELLQVVVSGSPTIKSTSIDWLPKQHVPFRMVPKGDGELVLTLRQQQSRRKPGSAYDFVKGACDELSDYVDWSRSCPLSVREVCHAFGIEAAYQCILQGLRAIMQDLGVAVSDPHLSLIADTATHTGKVTSLSTSGLGGFLKSLDISAPFLQAAQTRRLDIFEKAAELSSSDSLDDALSCATWGKRAEIGTGADFGIVWKQKPLEDATFGLVTEMDVDDFLASVPEPLLARPVGDAAEDSGTQAEEKKSDHAGWAQEDTLGSRDVEQDEAGWGVQEASSVQKDQTDNQEDDWGAPSLLSADEQGGWNDAGSRSVEQKQVGWGVQETDNQEDGCADENQDEDNFAVQEGTVLDEPDARRRSFKPTGANLQPLGPNKRFETKWSQHTEAAQSRGSESLGLQDSEAADLRRSQGQMNDNRPRPRARAGNLDPVRRRFNEEMFRLVGMSREILHCYQAGDPLSAEHQEFIRSKVLEHHPCLNEKLGIGMDYLKVDAHIEHPAKCFFVVRRDGTSVDFSYHKCLQGYVRKSFPEEYVGLYERQFGPKLHRDPEPDQDRCR